MTAAELVPVVRAVVAALVEAEVTMTPSQLETWQRALTRRWYPLLDPASRLQVIEENIRLRLSDGRAVLAVDDAGEVSVWCGGEES